MKQLNTDLLDLIKQKLADRMEKEGFVPPPPTVNAGPIDATKIPSMAPYGGSGNGMMGGGLAGGMGANAAAAAMPPQQPPAAAPPVPSTSAPSSNSQAAPAPQQDTAALSGQIEDLTQRIQSLESSLGVPQKQASEKEASLAEARFLALESRMNQLVEIVKVAFQGGVHISKAAEMEEQLIDSVIELLS